MWGKCLWLPLWAMLLPAAACAEEKVLIAELSPAAETAIDKGIDCLARTQNPDGSWGKDYQVAVTAVSLMAFMVKGYFPGVPPHDRQLRRAVDCLLKESRAGGGYMGKSMYEHALATLALSEVWGMSDRSEIRETVKLAVDIIMGGQNSQGGWRYSPYPSSADISVTVMQIVALASAKEAGIHVPNEVIRNAVRYVLYCRDEKSGGFGYSGPGTPGFARSAAGVMSLLMCGEREHAAVKGGIRYLEELPAAKFTQTEYYYYGHYYAIQSMYQAGEAHYQQWYPRIRDALVAKQTADGSWPGGEGGPDFCTSLAVLILGVPYRFLPIYQR